MSREEHEKSNEKDDVTVRFIVSDEKKKPTEAFNGLTKEQIEAYKDDPVWVRARYILFGLFWCIWIAMLVAAVLIVALTPRCAFIPKQNWWEKEVVYQIDVASFKDSDSDLIGDIKGVLSKMSYFETLGVKSLLFGANILDASLSGVKPQYGNEETLRELRKTLDAKDMHLIVDVPMSTAPNTNYEGLLNYWLTKFADGVRFTLSRNASAVVDNATLIGIVEATQKISKDTFKPKFVSFYPCDVNLGQSVLFDKSFMQLHNSNIGMTSDFLQSLYNAHNSSSNKIGFVMNDLGPTTRLAQRRLVDSHGLQHALVLLLKGTPFVLYGDELGLQSESPFMMWDSSANCGFSQNTTGSAGVDCSRNVKRALAHGAGETLARSLQKLAELRAKPSLNWGAVQFATLSPHVVSFVREAAGFDGYLVAANTRAAEAVSDFHAAYSVPATGTVEFAFRAYGGDVSDDFRVGQSVNLDSILLKRDELIVVSFQRQPVAAPAAPSASISH